MESLYAIGTVLTDRFNEKSNIDLVVNIDSSDPIEYADNYFNYRFALQDLFERLIDLLENKAIKNQFIRNNIDSSKDVIHSGYCINSFVKLNM
ncbi:MAG: hypothetical protein JW842_04860 [Prolixibacteraceae bacterium]|nr:hypothetical protein [Prolixibacteraceae bacterium]